MSIVCTNGFLPAAGRGVDGLQRRGMAMFGDRGKSALERPGAKWRFWMSGKTYFNGRAVCMHCRTMYMAVTSDGSFKHEDDEEIMIFFMLDRIPDLPGYPSTVRWHTDLT